MKCLHCGYCCIEYVVVIVNPKYVDTEIDFDNPVEDDVFICKNSNEPCPYLKLKDTKYYCSIHNKPWYKYTPCFQFAQIESSDSSCRMGTHILTTIVGEKIRMHLLNLFNK